MVVCRRWSPQPWPARGPIAASRWEPDLVSRQVGAPGRGGPRAGLRSRRGVEPLSGDGVPVFVGVTAEHDSQARPVLLDLSFPRSRRTARPLNPSATTAGSHQLPRRATGSEQRLGTGLASSTSRNTAPGERQLR